MSLIFIGVSNKPSSDDVITDNAATQSTSSPSSSSDNGPSKPVKLDSSALDVAEKPSVSSEALSQLSAAAVAAKKTSGVNLVAEAKIVAKSPIKVKSVPAIKEGASDPTTAVSAITSNEVSVGSAK